MLLQDGSIGLVEGKKNLFVLPQHKVAVRQLFPTINNCVVEENFWNAVRSHSSFSAERWEANGVAPLMLANLAVLLKKHCAYINVTSLGKFTAWSGDYKSPPLVCGSNHFGNSYVEKQPASTIRSFNSGGDLKQWPIIPAQRENEHLLVPLTELSLVVSGVADPIVQDVLVQLGVFSLDPAFPEVKLIRTMCSVADVDGTNIMDLMQSAAQAKRFESMKPEQRTRLLQWLLSSSENRGFFGGMLDLGTRQVPNAGLIQKLPLFERCVNGKWEFQPVEPGSYALPS